MIHPGIPVDLSIFKVFNLRGSQNGSLTTLNPSREARFFLGFLTSKKDLFFIDECRIFIDVWP